MNILRSFDKLFDAHTSLTVAFSGFGLLFLSYVTKRIIQLILTKSAKNIHLKQKIFLIFNLH